MTGKYLKRKATFSKKVNPMKYPVQTYILVSTWNLLFMYFTFFFFFLIRIRSMQG